jgi:hypothetical protein
LPGNVDTVSTVLISSEEVHFAARILNQDGVLVLSAHGIVIGIAGHIDTAALSAAMNTNAAAVVAAFNVLVCTLPSERVAETAIIKCSARCPLYVA